MVKPKYKKGLDISQLARSVVERATHVSLTPSTTPRRGSPARKYANAKNKKN